MAFKIQLRRGKKADIPVLDNGEMGYTQDTNELYVGTVGGNKKLTFDADKYASYDAQLAEKSQEIGDLTVLPTWLQESLSYAIKQHDSFLRDGGVSVAQPPYNCSGDGITDNTINIQKAIDDVSSQGGGTVYLPETGIFVFTSIKVKDNVRFKSYGATLKLKDNTCVDPNQGYYLVSTWKGGIDNYNNVTIDSLVIDGNNANNSQFKVADGITIGGENSKAINCHIFNVPDSGIMLSHGTNCVVFNNRINNGSDLGIYISDMGDDPDLIETLYENIIAFNRITGFPNGGIGLKRISQRCLVTLNTIYNCGNGITLEQAQTTTDYSKNISIIGNRMRHIGFIGVANPSRCINLRRSDHTIVLGNIMEDFKGIGVFIEGTSYSTVKANQAFGCANGDPTLNVGLQSADRDGVGCSYNDITSNIFDGMQYRGMYLSNTADSRGNKVSHNQAINAVNIGCRIGSGWTFNDVVHNTFGGSSSDISFAGGLDNLIKDNYLLHGTIGGAMDSSTRTAIQRNINPVNGKNMVVCFGIAIPTSLTWNQGDRIINPTPTVGQPKSWVCTVAGTPGTWVSEGNL